MNLILFEPQEIDRPLPRTDPRARHVLDVLRRKPGETFDAGLINGPRGKGTLAAIEAETIALTFTWEAPPPPAPAITLILGLPRPQTARDILRDTTTLGVSALHFIKSEKGEASYAQSTLWHSGEWRRHLLLGAEQAFDTRIPEVTHGHTLAEAVATLPATITRIVLDNYESPAPLSQCHVLRDTGAVLALGPERGWSAKERTALRAHGFTFAHLGPRVLRAETACVAALTMVRMKLGLM